MVDLGGARLSFRRYSSSSLYFPYWDGDGSVGRSLILILLWFASCREGEWTTRPEQRQAVRRLAGRRCGAVASWVVVTQPERRFCGWLERIVRGGTKRLERAAGCCCRRRCRCRCRCRTSGWASCFGVRTANWLESRTIPEKVPVPITSEPSAVREHHPSIILLPFLYLPSPCKPKPRG
jgi:hypothetical protein